MKQYTVQPGDSLYGIAKQLGTTVDEIKQLNNLSNNIISPGQIIVIQEDTNIPTTYVVKKGDNLYDIAKRFGLDVDQIKEINNLTSNALQIGQILNLELNSIEDNSPITMPIYENYVVKKGDSIYSIAKDFNTSVEQIKKDNNLTSNLLSLGQILKIRVKENMMGIEECYGEGYDEFENNYITYTVKKNDNLYSIARRYNTTVDAIMKLNNLSSMNLDIGQVLKIKEES